MKTNVTKQAVVSRCDKLFLSQKEAVKYIWMSKDWLEARREEGVLHYSKVANAIFYIKSEIDRLITDGACSGRQAFRQEVANSKSEAL